VAKGRRVIEFDATLRVGREIWRGVGVWDEPSNAGLWSLLAESVAYAFAVSAGPLLDRGDVFSFTIAGTPRTVSGIGLVSVAREIAKAPDDAPERVTWRPFVKVQEGESFNG